MRQAIHIIGGGTSSLFLAAFLDLEKFEVTIHEQHKTLGRKFLVAGDGGFNLTHSESIVPFIERYSPPSFLRDTLLNFSNTDLIRWFHDIGIETFIGSSKRVYPIQGIKPIDVLKAIENHLVQRKVNFTFNSKFTGFINGKTTLNNKPLPDDIVVFALGGGSWKVTGSDGHWLESFKQASIPTTPFIAANCAFEIEWPKDLVTQFEGSPLKNIQISCGNKTQKGEAVITSFGLEGNAIYALSPIIQEELEKEGTSKINIDLKPSLDLTTILTRIQNSKRNIGETLKHEIKLDSTQRSLLKHHLSKEEYTDPLQLANAIKGLRLEVSAPGPLDRAISTAGGVLLNAVNEQFELKGKANHYCIGEMLDWNAPTGGYLIQGCASMGVWLAKYFNENFRNN